MESLQGTHTRSRILCHFELSSSNNCRLIHIPCLVQRIPFDFGEMSTTPFDLYRTINSAQSSAIVEEVEDEVAV